MGSDFFGRRIDRRCLLHTAVGSMAVWSLDRSRSHGQSSSVTLGESEGSTTFGSVVGEPTGSRVGNQVLADGGNAFDAIVAAALACTVAAPHQTGVGGYGAHGVMAADGGRVIWALDANSAAPAALKANAFQPDEKGQVPGRINETGWLSAGVPGVLAGLDLVLRRFGTISFSDAVQPAIAIARDGVRLPASVCSVIAKSETMSKDPGSKALYFRNGEPPRPETLFRNPELADVLMTLAHNDSTDDFYRGNLAALIASNFKKHGGLVTTDDLANYRARLIAPISISAGPATVSTAPLTAGGLSVLQILMTLMELDWSSIRNQAEASRYLIEATRLAWNIRLTQFGDIDYASVPVDRMMSVAFARENAARVRSAVASGKPMNLAGYQREQGGTIHLSSADKFGNFAALTLTHGGAFGSQVTAQGLGLTLGHGMSRFDPRPDHPNAPGPNKRPLNNMVPVIISRNGRAQMAVGGRGGRKIPNAILSFLTSHLFGQSTLNDSIQTPRLHTEGTLTVELEKTWPQSDRATLDQFGYQIKTAASATLSAVASEQGRIVSAMR